MPSLGGFVSPPTAGPAFSDAQRFELLTRVQSSIASTRYTPCPPDLVDPLCWSIFDREARRTVAKGRTAAEATDNALSLLGITPEGAK